MNTYDQKDQNWRRDARYTISGTKGSESRDMVDSIWIRYEETSKHT